MKGYIKIEAVEMDDSVRLRTDCCLSGVSYSDRMQLMHTVARTLQLDSHDLKIWMLGESLSVFDQTTERTVLQAVDMQELLKQLREEREES